MVGPSHRCSAHRMTASQRRRDPVSYGRGWELAVVVAAVAVVTCGAVALLAVAVASQLFGGGWVWPHNSADGVRSLAGVVSGELRRGMPIGTRHRLANAGFVYSTVGVLEAATLAICIRSGMALSKRLRPDGMATRDDARRALGRGALLDAAGIIRPDLAGRRSGVLPTRGRRPQGPAHTPANTRTRRPWAACSERRHL